MYIYFSNINGSLINDIIPSVDKDRNDLTFIGSKVVIPSSSTPTNFFIKYTDRDKASMAKIIFRTIKINLNILSIK